MEWTSVEAKSRYDDFVAVAGEALVAFDLDGTLAPIIDDPERSRIHRDLPDVLLELAARVGQLAIVTGRPARQALDIGGLDAVGDRIGELGRELVVLGQYGNERWTSRERRIVSPRPPAGLSSFEQRLPRLLRSAGHPDVYVEEKGLAVAIHTRRLPDPDAALADLVEPVTEAAHRHGLVVEPGKQVLEVRGAGTDKGAAIRGLLGEHRGVLFAGDDLGDVPAFEAISALREDGLPALLVCAETEPGHALRPLADVVVDGPEGVRDLLRTLVGDLSR